jgi:hypothetical protein
MFLYWNMSIVNKIIRQSRGGRIQNLKVRVPEDCLTLQQAVDWVHKHRAYTTIVVGKGIHVINRGELVIPSAMNIMGDPRVPKSEIVVVGGICFEEGIQGHLEHLIISHARYCGVVGRSFTMDDVVVQSCKLNGVVCMGGIVKCNNVLVQECRSGVSVINGGSITLVGPHTKVCHNNQGLVAYGLSSVQASVIKVVSPMTKELVSTNNVSQNFSTGVFSIGDSKKRHKKKRNQRSKSKKVSNVRF